MALACTERVNKAVRMVIIFFIVVCFYVSNSCLYVERDACIIPLHREDTAFFYPAQQVFPNQGRENPYTSRGSATETTSRHLARRLARPWKGWGNALDYGHNILQTAGR